MPPIPDEASAIAILRMFPLNQLGFQVNKLDTEDALAANLKPRPGVPVLKINPQQTFEPDNYIVWFYEQVSPMTYIYAILGFGAVFAVVLFPLWPLFMRRGVWYLSMGLLGLIAAFFGLAIVRLIIYLITLVVLRPGLWIFPNLFEDLGVLDSFVPLYSWEGQDAMAIHRKNKKIKKSKKQKLAKLEKQRLKEQGKKDGAENTKAQGQALLMQQLQRINDSVEKRVQQRAEEGNPMSSAEKSAYAKELLQQYTTELRSSQTPSSAPAQASSGEKVVSKSSINSGKILIEDVEED